MQFRALGDLEVVDGGGPVLVGGTRPRATLGFLPLHNNTMALTSRTAEGLWSSDIPATNHKMLHKGVSGRGLAFMDLGGGASR
jgi:DNA-binding SARP family transcriptional activator